MYRRSALCASHGGVVDMQLNHASNWDVPGCVSLPEYRRGARYVDEPRDWNTPDNFTINYLIKSAGF